MTDAWWMYAILVLVTLPPMVPNSALLVGAGTLAATDVLSLIPLLLVVLSSMVVGDALVYWVGHRSSGRARAWLSRGARRRSMLEWLTGRLQRHGVPAVIAVRFVPAGRGLGGLAAGVTRFRLRDYLIGAAIAEAIFVSYTTGSGYVSGRLPAHDVSPLVIGPVVSLLVAGVAVVLRRGLDRRLGTAL
ncbi:VTT domain-containing protein [Streptomyces sp. B6B3]|uniref:DedA family protein n=1 Tax=Streptomyces sp. B6B3 TaxID=3153570 RepID=UPI00325F4919